MADASLSQDEIDALLSGADNADSGLGGLGGDAGSSPETDQSLSQNELDKISKISKSAAKAQSGSLSTLTSQEAVITVESGELLPLSDAVSGFAGETLIVKAGYSAPASANVFYLMSSEAGTAIAGMMSGSEVTALDEMALSTVQEAFNQMIGSSDSKAASEFNVQINNSGLKLSTGTAPDGLTIPDGKYYTVKSALKIGDTVNSPLIALFPVPLVKAMTVSGGPKRGGSLQDDLNMDSLLGGDAASPGMNIQNAEFSQLTQTADPEITGNINLLLDVPMEVTVELGRSSKTVQEVLSLGEGSIIELDKLAGEPVDLLVNGKPIARGEVVVIDENFGVRVTEIVSVKSRLGARE